jgi:hypothetical protein
MSDFAASAGYGLSLDATAIVAESQTITRSIGVVSSRRDRKKNPWLIFQKFSISLTHDDVFVIDSQSSNDVSTYFIHCDYQDINLIFGLASNTLPPSQNIRHFQNS